jgi:hypothetical protein
MSEKRGTAKSAVVTAHRSARGLAFAAMPDELIEVATLIHGSSKKLGSGHTQILRPGLDPSTASTGHSIILHDGEIPLTSFGLGTRRIVGLSVQAVAVAGGCIIAIGEIEQGLEPHRLVHVLRYLKNFAGSGELQVFLTSHSPNAIETLLAADLAVVRCVDGETTVHRVAEDLNNAQGTIRSGPDALLSRVVVIGEGATESGFIRRLFALFDDVVDAGSITSITAGMAVTNGGGGTQPLERAHLYHSLGYLTAVVMDNDVRDIDDDVSEAEATGVRVFRWTQGYALEDEIIQNAPSAGLLPILKAASVIRGKYSVIASIENHLTAEDKSDWDPSTIGENPDYLDRIRYAIAAAAKGTKGDGTKSESRAWFKFETGGEQLADFVHLHWSDIRTSSFGTTLTDLRNLVLNVTGTRDTNEEVSAG